MSSEIEDQRVVLVTGFGPFEGFPINFSWETVKQLWNLNRPLNIKLITRQLPVIYDVVREQVSKLWNDIKPDVIEFKKKVIFFSFLFSFALVVYSCWSFGSS